MWPDAQKFSDQFKKTTFDVVATTTFDEVFKIAGAIAVTAALGYVSQKYKGFASGVLYYACYSVISFYVGSRISYLMAGLARQKNPYYVLPPWVSYPALVLAGIGVGLFINALVRELTAANLSL